jgi:hypothetical protein
VDVVVPPHLRLGGRKRHCVVKERRRYALRQGKNNKNYMKNCEGTNANDGVLEVAREC